MIKYFLENRNIHSEQNGEFFKSNIQLPRDKWDFHGT